MSDMTIEKLANQVNELVTKQRESMEALEKKFDPVSQEVLTKIEKELGDACKSLSDMQIKAIAAERSQKELEEKLEKAGSRTEELELLMAAGAGQKSDEPQMTKYDRVVEEYLRKGDRGGMIGDMSSQDFIDGVGEAIISKSIKTNDPRLLDMARKDLIVGVNPDGGFFVTPQFGGFIEGRVFETSPLRNLSNIVTTTSDTFEFILDDDEADFGWVGEVDARLKTDSPQIAQILIPIHEIFAKPLASQKMIDDAGFDIAGWLQGKSSDRFGRAENSAFVIGDGSKRPKGFNTFADAADADTYERNKIGTRETASSLAIGSDDLKDLKGLLKEDYQSNAVWGMKRATWTEITKLKDSQNRYLFDMISNLRDGDVLQLLGQKVVLMDDMPDIAAGALSVVYADFRRSYTIVDRMGIRVLRDPFSSKPFIEFYMTKRVGGTVTNFDAIKRLKIKA